MSDEEIGQEFEEFSITIDDLSILDKCTYFSLRHKGILWLYRCNVISLWRPVSTLSKQNRVVRKIFVDFRVTACACTSRVQSFNL